MPKSRLSFVKKSIAALLAAAVAVTGFSPVGPIKEVKAEGNIHVYADTPGDVNSEKYTLTANETEVPVIKYSANGNHFDIARFSSSDPTPEYTVTVKEEIQTVTVYPERYYPKESITVSDDKKSLTFRMSDKLRYAFVMVNGGPADQAGKPYLAIINDPLENEADKPDVNADHVLNAKTFMEKYLTDHPNADAEKAEEAGTTSGGVSYEAGQLVENSTAQVRFPNKRKMTEDDMTYALQAALDEIYKEGSPYDTLYFPAGTYICSGLEIRNRKGKDVKIYLEEGALVKNRIQECMQAMEPAIGIWDSERITISGRGIFDGNGIENYRKDRHDAKDSCHQGGVMIVRSSNITFNDTYVRDAKQWNWESHGSKNCTLNNIKGLTPYPQPWVDGLDMASAQDLTINGAITLGNDDCFASGHYNPSDGFKNTVPGFDQYNSDFAAWDTEDSFNVSVNNTLGWSNDGGNGIRMGHNTYGHQMKNYSFDNLNAVNFRGGGRGITIQNSTGTYPRYESVSIKNCSFDTSRVGTNADIFGKSEDKIAEVTLENCWFSKKSAGFNFDNIKNLAIKDLYVGGEPIQYTSQIVTNLADKLAGGSIEQLVFTVGDKNVETNHLPVFTQPTGTVQAYAGAPLVFYVKAEDEDLGNAVTFGEADMTETEGAAFDKATGRFSWTPGEAQVGKTCKVTFTACDYTNQAVSHTVNIKISSTQKNEEHYIVSEDAHVQTWQAEKQYNFGRTPYLAVRNYGTGELGETGLTSTSDSTDGKLVFLKFDLSQIKEKKGQFDTAMLSLTKLACRDVKNQGANDTLKVTVVDDNSWQEGTGISDNKNVIGEGDKSITWLNKPAFTAEAANVVSASYQLPDRTQNKPGAGYTADGTQVNVDITNIINKAIESGNTTLTLAVNNSNVNEHYFVSKEGALGTDGNGKDKYANGTADMAPAIVLDIPQQPEIKGTESMTLQEGYAAAETNSFAILGFEKPEVSLSGNTGEGKITWDGATHQIKIGAGLAKGEYQVKITAAESEKNAAFDFTLTVTENFKKSLQELYDAKKGLSQVAYTSVSWEKFAKVLTGIENLLKKDNVTAQEAENAQNALDEAEKALVTLASVQKEALEEYQVDESSKADYTEESWQAYQTAYQAVKDLPEGYTESQMDEKITALKTAYEGLTKKDASKPMTPEEIKAALEKAAEDCAVAESDKDLYTAESWEAYQTAYQELKDLQGKEGYTQEEAEQAIAKLKKAYQDLQKAEPSKPMTPEEMEAALNKAVQDYAVPAGNQGLYTEESWKAYTAALQKVQDLQKTGGYTEEEMTQAVDALQKAFHALQKKEDPEKPDPEKPNPEKPGTQQPENPGMNSGVKVEEITVSGEIRQLAKGKSMALKAEILPENASDKKIKWSSSNEKVAVVNENGLVTGTGKGTAVITAAALDGSGETGTYEVKVVSHAVKKIKLKLEGGKIASGKKMQVKATISATGKDANKKLAWSSSNEKFAAVNAKGTVTAKKAGIGKTVTITARATDGSGARASVKVKIVKHSVKKVALRVSSKTLKAGKKLKIKAIVKVTGKTASKTLSWTTSNKKYAAVNAKGVVTAKKAGRGKTVTIKAVSTDGTNKKASIKLRIK